ncbi:MAG TPA: hypothetical protein VMS22_12205 [Candidatus Eisenbacteria bacterium]|nr:hypothetical protein [Candidatus Eisenbacteria bacterium]
MVLLLAARVARGQVDPFEFEVYAVPTVGKGMLELYGGMGSMSDPDPLHAQEHYLMPVLRGELADGIDFDLGVGIGLTSGSDQIVLKLNIGFEHLVAVPW